MRSATTPARRRCWQPPSALPAKLSLRAEFRHARHEWRPPPAALLALPGLWHDGALLASPLHVADGIRAEFVLRPANPVATAPFAGPNVV